MSLDGQSSLGPVGYFTLGVASEIFTVATTQPLDTLKTYTMNRMGWPRISQLWNGCSINCLGAFVQGGIPFLVNGMLIQKLSHSGALTSSVHLTVGIATGLLSSVATAPFDRIAKLQQSYNLTMMSALHCARAGKAGGLFKHIGPIAYRDALVLGAFFGGRKIFSEQCEQQIPNRKVREIVSSVGLGAISGFLSSPLDKISIWMATDTAGKYTRMLQTGKAITIEQGRLGLFRGATMRASVLGIYMLALGYAEQTFKQLLLNQTA